jgi:hypothetical protein
MSYTHIPNSLLWHLQQKYVYVFRLFSLIPIYFISLLTKMAGIDMNYCHFAKNFYDSSYLFCILFVSLYINRMFSFPRSDTYIRNKWRKKFDRNVLIKEANDRWLFTIGTVNNTFRKDNGKPVGKLLVQVKFEKERKSIFKKYLNDKANFI